MQRGSQPEWEKVKMTISSGNVLFIGGLLKRHFSRVVRMRSRMEGIYKRMEGEEVETKVWKILQLCYKRGTEKWYNSRRGIWNYRRK